MKFSAGSLPADMAPCLGFCSHAASVFPLPEDVPLIASGILIADHRMHLAIAAPLAWLGIVGGDCILYTIGHRYGKQIVKIPLIGKHVTRASGPRRKSLPKIRRLDGGRWPDVHGNSRRYDRCRGNQPAQIPKFIIADGLAAIVSGGLFMVLGYWGGKDGRVIGHRVRIFRHTMWATAGVLAIILIIFFFWRDRRRSSRADGDASAVPASRQ